MKTFDYLASAGLMDKVGDIAAQGAWLLQAILVLKSACCRG